MHAIFPQFVVTQTHNPHIAGMSSAYPKHQRPEYHLLQSPGNAYPFSVDLLWKTNKNHTGLWTNLNAKHAPREAVYIVSGPCGHFESNTIALREGIYRNTSLSGCAIECSTPVLLLLCRKMYRHRPNGKCHHYSFVQ